MSILSPYEQYKRNIIKHETSSDKKEEINEEINVSLNTHDTKRILADKLRKIAENIEFCYVYVDRKEDGSSYGAPSLDDKYEKRHNKIAAAHQAEIKKLMSTVNQFKKDVDACLQNLNKAKNIKEETKSDDTILESKDIDLNAHMQKMIKNTGSDKELNDYLINLQKSLTSKSGQTKKELSGHIEGLMGIMRARGQNPLPRQEKAYAKIKKQLDKSNKR